MNRQRLATAPSGRTYWFVLGDFRQGKDGLVAYSSAHLDYTDSECIVRGGHSCQSQPATIEEMRRILHAHLASLPAGPNQPHPITKDQ